MNIGEDNMAKWIVYKVRVNENFKSEFERLMNNYGIPFDNTGEFRITDLDAFIKGKQKSID